MCGLSAGGGQWQFYEIARLNVESVDQIVEHLDVTAMAIPSQPSGESTSQNSPIMVLLSDYMVTGCPHGLAAN